MTTSTVEPPVSTEAIPAAARQFFDDIAEGQPLRAELFGVEHLELHAKSVAAASPIIAGRTAGHPLLARFSDNGRRLIKAHERIVEATRRQESLAPDAEWLLDNFHIVLDTLREVRHDLPGGYYKELPKLSAGALAGFPRVYAVALELIAHTDSTLDEGNITRFVRAFQTVAPLTIGELWAVPIMLRLGVIENLRRLAEQMLAAWEHRRQAENCCGTLVNIQGTGRPADRHSALASFLRTQPTAAEAFVVRLLQALRDQGHEAAGLIAWLETHFTAAGTPPVEVLRREQQRQATNQVSVGNCVTSLRLLSALDWTVLFERMSLVEVAFRDDPAGVYARQDFATKDRYRRAVETFARGSDLDELTVARRALDLARREAPTNGEATRPSAADTPRAGAGRIDPSVLRRRHVGYYLVGPGRKELAAGIAFRPRLRQRFLDAVLDHANAVYFGALTLVFTALAVGGALSAGSAGLWPRTVLLLAALLPLSELTVGLVHYLVTLVLPPRVLPKLDFKDGIPADCATFVVMPTLLLRREGAKVLSERLEVHYLSNPDPLLRFALLTDFSDAASETTPEDESYLQAAFDCIKILNERYPLAPPATAGGHGAGQGEAEPRFYLFHRRRVWNAVQGCWMGWERKRGKLAEFNRLLRGEHHTSFVWTNADLSKLPFIRYVITLDADTELPRETARRLIGTLAHPLNQPCFDPAKQRVVSGYGVLQPRVTLSLIAATRSRFSRILTSSAGIDPYTTAVSDVYQDAFGSGSFTGKGVYDVDAFQAATGQLFPENRILSHDLIEGNFARCGLATDIELIDDFPSRYNAHVRRDHRWIRGDWQLLPWLGRTVPAPATAANERGRRRNTLPALARWKIIDNLRRSLIPPALMLLFILGWTLPAGSFWFWTGLAILVMAVPLFITLIGGLFAVLATGSLFLELRELSRRVKATGGQLLLNLIFLADQAGNSIDAVSRTLVRLIITRRQMLEWETAATTERRLGVSFADFCLTMWPAVSLAMIVALVVALVQPQALLAAGPITLLWFISPAVAFWVSQPRRITDVPLDAEERRKLRRIARKTWSFFEAFVGADDGWLPPDNFQEDPKGAVAHRTSPTNIGLYLLSTMAAHDFGYLTLPELAERLEKTFATLDRLDRFHGHFYNWYDTQTLRPLQPSYVSTVDSGNLLGCLLALKQGLREKIETSIPESTLLDGLYDTLNLVREEFQAVVPPKAPEPLEVFNRINAALADVSQGLQDTISDLSAREIWLQQMDQRALELCRDIQRLAAALQESPEQLARWAERFAAQVSAQRNEVAALAPWLNLLREPRPPGDAEVGTGIDKTRWQALRQRLLATGTVADMQAHVDTMLPELAALETAENADPAGAGPADRYALSTIAQALKASTAPELLERCQSLADRALAFARAMDFRILFNEPRQLFSIGFNLGLNRLDNAHYDLLASEACLTSFLAIARAEVPKRHWFHLGRPLTRVGGGIALLSWGGTMFEYLMPRLLLRGYPETLLHESWSAAVARQIDYGRQHRVPWGISESGFSALDVALDYQYQSFGVPGLGLKRGLGQNLVVAPYATALALAMQPHAALENFERLRTAEAEGPYGFYEAVDYTRDRLVEKRRPAIVRSYMAHHQGMSLVALANCLMGDVMVRRFHSEPIVRATELLLQERLPSSAPLQTVHGDESAPRPAVSQRAHALSRRVTTPDTPHPRTHLLSNRRYSVMVTNAGAGYSTWDDIDVTRWREDRTRDALGQFVYVRDLRSGLLWSAGHQPVCRPADSYEVLYSTDKAEFHRFDGGIETHLEITVSAENAAEVRRLTLTNHTARAHELELTSYAEIVLGPHAADLAHPAFGKLFLETEFIPAQNALLCRRRPRAPEQKPIWAIHVLAVDGRTVGNVQFETDRARFLGRGRTPANPAALERNAQLSGSTGPVLDPIFSLRRRIQVGPGTSVAVAFTTAVAESREQALALADQYHDFHGVNRAFEMAWAHTQVELRHLRVSAEDLHLYQRLAAHLIYAGQTLRAASAVTSNRLGQSGLWKMGISGDKPIILARISETDELPLVRQLLEAHSYWRLKGLSVDLVLLNEHPASYYEELHEELLNMVRASDAHTLMDKPGGVFARKAAQLADDDRLLLQAAARAVLVGNRGSLAGQVDRSERTATVPERLIPGEKRADRDRGRDKVLRPPSDLLFANGLGGFARDGREYVITIDRRAEGAIATSRPQPALEAQSRAATPQLPPAPWVNVISNPKCGFLISESGAGYTWAWNSQANRLTPWNNDPVSDTPGEAIYLRDDDTGEFWTPTPLPVPASAPTIVRHGQGYSYFDQQSHGLSQELLLFVPPDDPIKLCRLRIRNLGTRERRLSTIFYVEWVLGTVRDQAAMNVVPSIDPETGALLARNAFNTDFAEPLAFADVSLRPRTCTADRTEFLGRNGSVAAPAALGRVELSGRMEPTLDPCAAIMAPFVIGPGADIEIVFFLGQAVRQEDVRRLLRRYRDPVAVETAFREVCKRWDRVLGAVAVRTPNAALDLLLNRWLLYQVLSCRVWGRSGFYQSGGAYGFRDQLQDVMALVHGAPQEERGQILRAAGRQFVEGDVQHWWHPPAGRGTRTRFSDDLLWLPLVTCHYVETTGDAAILDEKIPFLKGPLLAPGQDEAYFAPEVSAETETLYEHCLRALERGMRFGSHGLPLMGSGDWNDGMNRVGAGGKGESVWNGWFLIAILQRFIPVAERRGDKERAAGYRAQIEHLRAAIEEHAWDGRWYRRAYFDDGTPLGSEQNDECKIDSLPQSWAVISGVADPERARTALAAVEEYLVKQAEKMILLFTPPFDQGKLQPGYIKGYVPGIRENGGQYTHAATWVVQATALLGQGNRAMELFDLLNPIQHARTAAEVERYKVEPYVVVADIYGHAPHTGRGGWTWYTGSAGWFYRIGLENILGFRREGNVLSIQPCIPKAWPKFELTYTFGSATYHVTVENPRGVERGVQTVWLDGKVREDKQIELADDGVKHEVRVLLGG